MTYINSLKYPISSTQMAYLKQYFVNFAGIAKYIASFILIILALN